MTGARWWDMEIQAFRRSRTGFNVPFGLSAPRPADDVDCPEAMACPTRGRFQFNNKTSGRAPGDEMRSEKET